ncbi:3-deoxy-manno-octulosonate cytidylyltransferase (CMP-KDO synthetase) [Dysgonomonas sp. PH5-45]|uniref:3-deoxy-manno-octulosonate cytidylyltransferase n=1 Tax=unclassified Dysgonomonas TaxID=2630389 RepID=UPI00247360E7|nr:MULTISPECIES: 3-deoxy-manno-octulosonate cytidylyltransferase [unclassified Dysgonomonas]MDH6355983.1 3-deoxy-manno-octulosonate cytidylyltransferase (CMP-KDO synthetase) [Dysgonomonas sp. PH5-45]MDH6388872.1 3-deoxy-manno-octulosonate cytidylyltransferase (CMP-KDO synthetase) [Dysgonomonas sp. PH5-37]
MKFIGIIPARYGSSRFPGKPLADMAGKPMIQRVYEQVKKALNEVWVATDDERIADAVHAFGGNAVMTSTHHRSGTDRCREAFRLINKKDFDVIVNIQGDEPFIQPEQIETLIGCFSSPNVQLATLVKPFTEEDGFDALFNPNSPKVVINKTDEAIYFSRSIVPYIRDAHHTEWLGKHTFFKHIGMYAYRANVLEEITQLPPSSLELAESLEQLRWIENGYKIKVGYTTQETIGIDTPEDMENALKLLALK